MILFVKLYLVLLEVGALAFGGGLATLPLLQQALVHDQAWLSATEWTDVFTISNMTPGPIAINAATFVGTKMGATLGLGLFGQVLGSIVASLGVITPQIILMTILAHLMFKGRTFKPLNWAIQALRSATVGLIAAIIMDLLSAIQPKACLFLGKCGGIDKKNRIGDLILPIAAIRGEGTSNDYFPPEVPSLPAFMLQRAVSSAIRDYARDYWTGTVYTTNRRIWEHDEEFKEYLKKTRAMAVDMETATLFSCGFANHIPTGALLLVSDQPMIPEGVKTDKSDNLVTQNYVKEHVEIGIASLRMIIDEKKTVKHLKFDW